MLTPKQEKFAQCVAEGMTQADAYRSAYNTKAKPETIQANASRMMADSMISARVAELRKPIVAKVGITLEGHLADLLMLRNAALNGEQYSAAISAEIARGKASGVAVDKITADVNASVAHSIEIRIVKNNS
jgi:phage terminase small subunit